MDHIESSVEDTNAEALVAKISAIHLGYFPDPFAEKFCKANSKKECIINRGYWARVQAIKEIVEKFLKIYENQPKQIISLGAGYDTLFFNLRAAGKYDFERIKYIEMDLPGVVKRKVRILKEHPELLDLINPDKKYEIGEGNSTLKSAAYSIAPIDLRHLDHLIETLKNYGIDYKAPTLVFAECVLIYLPTNNADDIMRHFREEFETVYLMNWEMMKLKDPFGKMMIHNFEAKGYDLLGINDYPDLASLEKRFKDLGYVNVEVYDMLDVYNHHIDQNERKRIEKIEWLDELEEWNIIQKHYYFALCSKVKDQTEGTHIVKIHNA